MNAKLAAVVLGVLLLCSSLNASLLCAPGSESADAVALLRDDITWLASLAAAKSHPTDMVMRIHASLQARLDCARHGASSAEGAALSEMLAFARASVSSPAGKAVRPAAGPGVFVRIVDDSTGALIPDSSVTSDEHGLVEAATGEVTLHLQAGNHAIWARAPGYTVETAQISVSWVVPTNVEFRLRRGGRIRGTARDQVSGAAIAGARIYLHDTTGLATASSDSATDGSFDFDGVPPGTYYVRSFASLYGYRVLGGDRCYPPGAGPPCDARSGTPFEVTAGSEATVEVPMVRGAGISGTVRSTNGGPVAGIPVVINAAGVYQPLTFYSQADGSWATGALTPNTTYFAMIYESNFHAAQIYDGMTCCVPQDGEPIVFDGGSGVTGVDFLLTANTGGIAGVVRDTDGDPIPGVRVQLGASFVETDPGGRYNLAAPTPIGWLTFSHPQFAGASTMVNATSGWTTVNMTLQRLARIEGRVLDSATGTPVPALVRLTSGFDTRTITTNDGSYSFSALSGGPFSVQASAAGYLVTSQVGTTCPTPDFCWPARTINVVNNGTATVDVALVPRASVEFAVRQKHTGIPVAATITAYKPDGNTADVRALAPGTYRFTASAYGHESQAYPNIACSPCGADSGAPVTLGAGVTVLEFELEPTGVVLQGTVRARNTGAPIAGAVIRRGGVRVATTDANGRYAVAAGNTQLTADAEGFVRQLHDGTDCEPLCARAVTRSGKGVETVDFSLKSVFLRTVSPFPGPVSGGTPLELRGFGFQPGVIVSIGGTQVAVERVSSQFLRVTAPGGDGAVDVAVTNPDGESSVYANGYRYGGPPAPEPLLRLPLANSVARFPLITAAQGVRWISDGTSVWLTDGAAEVTTRFEVPATDVVGAAGTSLIVTRGEPDNDVAATDTDGTVVRLPVTVSSNRLVVSTATRLFVRSCVVTTCDHWTTDGTSAGTRRLDLPAREFLGGASTDTTAFFAFLRPDGWSEVWFSGGAPGDEQVAFAVHGRIDRMYAKSALWFTMSDAHSAGLFVWRGSGEPVGITEARALRPGLEHGAFFYYYRFNGVNYELWRTDGTREGVAEVMNGVTADTIAATDAAVYFSGYQPATGFEIFKVEGIGAPSLVADLSPGGASTEAISLAAGPQHAYLTTFINQGSCAGSRSDACRDLWVGGGAVIGLVRLAGRADGTGLDPRNLATSDEGVLFTGRHPDGSTAVWRADGATPPELFTTAGGLVRTTSDGYAGTASELYVTTNSGVVARTDGTVGGTFLFAPDCVGLAPARHGVVSLCHSLYSISTLVGGTRDTLVTTDGQIFGMYAYGGLAYVNWHGLWRFDGSFEGTTKLSEKNVRFVGGAGPHLYATVEYEDLLVRTDGATAPETVSPGVVARSVFLVGSQIYALTGDGVYRVGGAAPPVKAGSLPFESRSSSSSATGPIVATAAGLFTFTDRLEFLHDLGGERFRLLMPTGAGMYVFTDYSVWLVDASHAVRRVARVDAPLPVVERKGILFFSGDDGRGARVLFRTDGTMVGTWMLSRGAGISGGGLVGETLVTSLDLDGRGYHMAAVRGVVDACAVPRVVSLPALLSRYTESAGVALRAAVAGDALTFQWFEGARGVTSAPVATNPDGSAFVSPGVSTHYWLRITNGCGSADSETVSVVVRSRPSVSFTTETTRVRESEGTATVALRLRLAGGGPLVEPARIRVNVQPVGSASPRYSVSTHEVVFGVGAVDGAEATVGIPIIDDADRRGTVTLALGLIADSANPGSNARQNLYVLDDEAAAGALFTVPPCRLLDRRPYPITYYALGVTGRCGIPESARAIAANVTVVGAKGPGHLTIHPWGTQIPTTSTVNFRAGQVRANNAILPIGDAGTILIRPVVAAADAAVHVIVDVSGYFE